MCAKACVGYTCSNQHRRTRLPKNAIPAHLQEKIHMCHACNYSHSPTADTLPRQLCKWIKDDKFFQGFESNLHCQYVQLYPFMNSTSTIAPIKRFQIKRRHVTYLCCAKRGAGTRLMIRQTRMNLSPPRHMTRPHHVSCPCSAKLLLELVLVAWPHTSHGNHWWITRMLHLSDDLAHPHRDDQLDNDRCRLVV